MREAEGAQRTVLIADDEPGIRRLVGASIGSDLYQVVGAEDGDSAWDLLRHHHPVLAVLDVQMPGRGGLELTRAIRSDPELRTMRVVLLSAKGHAADIQAGLAAGADLYLTKPFSPLELLNEVEHALNIA